MDQRSVEFVGVAVGDEALDLHARELLSAIAAVEPEVASAPEGPPALLAGGAEDVRAWLLQRASGLEWAAAWLVQQDAVRPGRLEELHEALSAWQRAYRRLELLALGEGAKLEPLPRVGVAAEAAGVPVVWADGPRWPGAEEVFAGAGTFGRVVLVRGVAAALATGRGCTRPVVSRGAALDWHLWQQALDVALVGGAGEPESALATAQAALSGPAFWRAPEKRAFLRRILAPAVAAERAERSEAGRAATEVLDLAAAPEAVGLAVSSPEIDRHASWGARPPAEEATREAPVWDQAEEAAQDEAPPPVPADDPSAPGAPTAASTTGPAEHLRDPGASTAATPPGPTEQPRDTGVSQQATPPVPPPTPPEVDGAAADEAMLDAVRQVTAKWADGPSEQLVELAETLRGVLAHLGSQRRERIIARAALEVQRTASRLGVFGSAEARRDVVRFMENVHTWMTARGVTAMRADGGAEARAEVEDHAADVHFAAGAAARVVVPGLATADGRILQTPLVRRLGGAVTPYAAEVLAVLRSVPRVMAVAQPQPRQAAYKLAKNVLEGVETGRGAARPSLLEFHLTTLFRLLHQLRHELSGAEHSRQAAEVLVEAESILEGLVDVLEKHHDIVPEAVDLGQRFRPERVEPVAFAPRTAEHGQAGAVQAIVWPPLVRRSDQSICLVGGVVTVR